MRARTAYDVRSDVLVCEKRNIQRPFPLGGVRKTGPDVVAHELPKVLQGLVHSHAGSKVAKNGTDGTATPRALAQEA